MYDLILSNFAMHIELSAEEEQYVIAKIKHKTVTKRTTLLSPGEVNRYIYFVNKGCLRVFYTDKNGLEHNLNFCPENWWACDIVSFFKERPAVNAIQALEDTELFCFSFSQIEELFNEMPKFQRFFLVLTQNGYDLLQRRVTYNLSLTAQERYMRFRKQYPGLEQRIAQKHVAAFLGITPAFLSMMRKEKGI